ncbi:hypothetical protein CCMA1212_008368 [Trichoderma ghanense]|uniref:Lysine-specific metallo-endopeptidase domain-containing protein n=1 Tax=Trichoderma ghanense TaxID=65468 RepID=A0ABY2GZ00_9HYPO
MSPPVNMMNLLLLLVLAPSITLSQGNPIASRMFTLVNCDNTGLDNMLLQIHALAQAVVDDLSDVLDGNTYGDDDGSKEWYTARNLRLLFGTAFSEVDGQPGGLRFQGESEAMANDVRYRFLELAHAFETFWWDPRYNYIFCRAESDPLPFKKPVVVGDWFDLAPPDELQNPITDDEDWDDNYVYYRNSPYYRTDDENLNGRRMVVMESRSENVCEGAADAGGNKPRAFMYIHEGDFLQWMAFCNSFWDVPQAIENSDDGDNLDDFITRHTALLHELMHMRYPRLVVDIKDRVGVMEEDRNFYGWNGATALGVYKPDQAYNNADNYRLLAETVAYKPRHWRKPVWVETAPS